MVGAKMEFVGEVEQEHGVGAGLLLELYPQPPSDVVYMCL